MRHFEPRLRTVLAATVVAGTPTYFAIFPGSSRWPIRAAIFAIWVLVAASVGLAAARFDDRIADFVGARLDKRAEARFLAGSVAIRSVLSCAPEKLRVPDWRVYLYDNDLDRLLPSYETSGDVAQSLGWEIGRGVTGRCYQLGEYVVARGGECSGDSYGLDARQRQRYRELHVVAAFPLRTATHQVIGALTASATVDDGSLTSPEGQDWHIKTANVIARILIDVVRLADD